MLLCDVRHLGLNLAMHSACKALYTCKLFIFSYTGQNDTVTEQTSFPERSSKHPKQAASVTSHERETRKRASTRCTYHDRDLDSLS